MAWSRIKTFSFLIILLSPVFIYYICHFSGNTGNGNYVPTGFIQSDMPYYMANAREYKEMDQLQLLYPLPFSDNYQNQGIYFQPQTFLLGMVLRYFPIDPAFLFLLFGAICAILCLWMLQKILFLLAGEYTSHKVLLMLCLVWGGGIMFLSGMTFNLSRGLPFTDAFSKAFVFDPHGGWWFLNLGRNFIYPFESYYHLLFFTSVYFVLKRNYGPALIYAGILAFSHPFTGLFVILLYLCWGFMEFILVRSGLIKPRFLVILCIISALFAYYYAVFLPSSPEHQALVSQWKLDWNLSYLPATAAYVIVLVFAIIRISGKNRLKAFVNDPFNRFLLVWFFVNFILENHDLFIKPLQPLHFTRGYLWTCLFLIGARSIAGTFEFLFARKSPVVRYVLVSIFAGMFILDNLFWFSKESYKQLKNPEIALSNEQNQVLGFLGTHFYPGHILVSQDDRLGYFSTVYTAYRPYVSHPFNTPAYNEKKLIQDSLFYSPDNCKLPDGRPMVIVLDSNRTFPPESVFKKIYKTGSYSVYIIN